MKKVYVISGAPGSGKSTYVQKRATEQDLIVDLDYIADALHGGSGLYRDNSAIMDALLAARSALYDSVGTRRGKWENAYIITTKNAAEVSKELRGELIQMDATKEECKKRILADERRQDKNRFLSLVDKWFEDNGEEDAPKSTPRDQFAKWFESAVL